MPNRFYSDVHPDAGKEKNMGEGKGNDDGRLGGEKGKKSKPSFTHKPGDPNDDVSSISSQSGAE